MIIIADFFLQSFHVTIGTGKEWRVVCYGSYSDIYVLDALSLEVHVCGYSMFTDCIQ